MRKYRLTYNIYQGEYQIDYTYTRTVEVRAMSLQNAVNDETARQKRSGVGIDITKAEMI